MTLYKHVDFEARDWSEFAHGPQTSGEGAALSQAAGAEAFPDRPRAAGTTLRVTLTAGAGASYLEHDLGQPCNQLHNRLLMNPGTLGTGAVTILRGIDAAGGETFSLIYDGSDRTLTAAHIAGPALTAPALSGLAWHCVELRIDAGGAALWLDGLPAGVASFSPATVTRRLRLGAVEKDAATTGAFHLDEWIMSDSYIGPVAVAPVSEFADDPSRWLVIYNSADADSAAWAEGYRTARRVPCLNVLGFDTGTDEVIGATDYHLIRQTIEDYLSRHGLGGQIIGVLLGFRVPGYADLADGVGPRPLTPLLCGATSLTQPNPIARGDTRPSASHHAGLRLAARVDGPTLADANAWVERATAIMNARSMTAAAGNIWVDPSPVSGSFPESVAAMRAWIASRERMETRLPLRLPGPGDSGDGPRFNSIEDDGFYWGWSQDMPPVGFFAGRAGWRVFSLPLGSAQALTLRDTTPTGWLHAALSAGYAAAAGHTRGWSDAATPDVRAFFAALRRGWTIAEAWLVANPFPGSGLFLVGDPLLTVPLPRAGWDVYGPLDRLEALDPQQPSLFLRDDENSAQLPASLRPAEGRGATYLVRRRDVLGRSEAGVTAVRTTTVAGHATDGPLEPVWPDAEGWPVAIESGVLRLAIMWERPLRMARVKRVELQHRVGAGAVQTIHSMIPDAAANRVELAWPLPPEPARFRWRVVGGGGAAFQSPWSAPVRAAAAPTLGLQLLEAAP